MEPTLLSSPEAHHRASGLPQDPGRRDTGTDASLGPGAEGQGHRCLPRTRGGGTRADASPGLGRRTWAQMRKDSVIPALFSRVCGTRTWCLHIRSRLGALVVGRGNLYTSVIRTHPSLSSCHQHQPAAQIPQNAAGASGFSGPRERLIRQHFPVEPEPATCQPSRNCRWVVRAPLSQECCSRLIGAPAERRMGS